MKFTGITILLVLVAATLIGGIYLHGVLQVKAQGRHPRSLQLQAKAKRDLRLLNDGIAASRAGDLKTAETKLKECNEDQGGYDAFALEKLAAIYQQEGRTEEAIQAYRDILHPVGGLSMSSMQSDGVTAVKYAGLLNDAGRWPEAVQAYAEALENPGIRGAQEQFAPDEPRLEVHFDPAIPQKKQMRAMLHVALGRRFGLNYNAAGAEFAQAVNADPASAIAHFYKGYALAGQGNGAVAQVEFVRASRLDATGTVKAAAEKAAQAVRSRSH